MSTKFADTPQAVTDQTRPTVLDGLRAVAGSFVSMGTYGGHPTAWAITSPMSRPAIHQVSEKAVEANRQIERVKSIASICKKGGAIDDVCLESIASSVTFIGSLVTGQIPIPVASSGSDGCTTLFFDDDDFYGDLEIRGKSIEYYIKSKTRGKDVEVFDSEDMENGFIPPKLLIHLFAHYAR